MPRIMNVVEARCEIKDCQALIDILQSQRYSGKEGWEKSVTEGLQEIYDRLSSAYIYLMEVSS